MSTFRVNRIETLRAELERAAADFQRLVDEDVASVNRLLEKGKLEKIEVLSLVEWVNKQEAGGATATLAPRFLSSW